MPILYYYKTAADVSVRLSYMYYYSKIFLTDLCYSHNNYPRTGISFCNINMKQFDVSVLVMSRL